MKIFLFLLPVVFCACTPDSKSHGKIEGYVPVYLSATQAKAIVFEPPLPTKNAGKIYAYNNYLFQVEEGKGIHIINNASPQQAVKTGFIAIPGCSDMAIKSGYLYANNINDLIVINLASITAPVVVNRQADAFPQISQQYPPLNNVYFECPDPSKGVIIGWELKTIETPKCRR